MDHPLGFGVPRSLRRRGNRNGFLNLHVRRETGTRFRIFRIHDDVRFLAFYFYREVGSNSVVVDVFGDADVGDESRGLSHRANFYFNFSGECNRVMVRDRSLRIFYGVVFSDGVCSCGVDGFYNRKHRFSVRRRVRARRNSHSFVYFIFIFNGNFIFFVNLCDVGGGGRRHVVIVGNELEV